MNQKQVSSRYVREFSIAMVAYTIILIASIHVIKAIEMPQTLKVFVALTPAVPVTFVLIAVMRRVRDSDELQQRVNFLATSFSAGITGLVTFTYGFLENLGFPKFSTFLILPMLIFFWGMSLFWFSKRYE